MFMDSMISPINVHSINKKLFTKHDSRNTKENIFLKKINFLGFHAVLVKTFLL